MRTFGRFVKLVLQTQYNASFIAGVINRQKFLDWGIFQTVCKGELASLNLSSVFFFKHWTSYTSYTKKLGLPKLLFVLEIA